MKGINRRKFLYLTGLAAGLSVIGRLATAPRFDSSRLAGLTDRHSTMTLSAQDLAAGDLNNVALVDDELRLAGASEGICRSPAIRAPFDFSLLGSYWQTLGGDVTAAVRVSTDGKTWQSWQDVPIEPAEREDMASIVFGALRGPFHLPLPRFVQIELTLRRARDGTLPAVRWLALAFIDTSRGPTTAQALASVGAAAQSDLGAASRPTVISRTAWGCPGGQSSPDWPAEYQTATHIFVHHTATANEAADWAAVVRAIWYYHSVDLGWGDIGYHFLVDPNGYLYEGRAGGDDVIAGHTYGFNRGSVGLAFLGTYSMENPPSAMVSGAEALLAWKADQRGIDVATSGPYQAYPSCSAATVTIPHLLGHRDAPGHGDIYDACNVYGPTSCPGDRLWALLPALRNDVANMPIVTLNPVTTSKTWFILTWQGRGGTGSLTYTVNTSSDGSTWHRWLTTSRTAALFVGDAGQGYYFICTATDSRGRSGSSARVEVQTGGDASGLHAARLLGLGRDF